MNAKNFYNSLLRDVRALQMSPRVRMQAENGVRASATLIEALLSMASYVGFRAK